MAFFHPITKAIHYPFAGDVIGEVQHIAATCPVNVLALLVLPIIRPIINATLAERWKWFLRFCRVVKYHV